MKHRTLHSLYAYWNDVRAGRLAPRRLEIEPSRIASILAETFMLERLDDLTFQYRLAGTRLCELFGSELRGTNFLEGWNAEDRATLERHLALTCQQGAATLLTFEAVADIRHRIDVEVILLPLLHAGNKVGRIIGAMGTVSMPPWLASERLGARRLVRHETIWPDGRPHAVAERIGAKPFPPRPVAPPPIVKFDRRKFRVLEGGRSNPKYHKD
jgi:hypothetical protein